MKIIMSKTVRAAINYKDSIVFAEGETYESSESLGEDVLLDLVKNKFAKEVTKRGTVKSDKPVKEDKSDDPVVEDKSADPVAEDKGVETSKKTKKKTINK